MNPFQVVKDFEAALADYTGAPYVVTTTSCTMALLLAVAYQLQYHSQPNRMAGCDHLPSRPDVEIPKRTYVGVPYAIREAGGRPTFRDEDWRGMYQLKPLQVFDSARWLTAGIYIGATVFERAGAPIRGTLRALPGTMICLSFHWSKTLGIQQGGAILHDDPAADRWLRMARFDGRVDSLSPERQAELKRFELPRAWHAYMSPETAAAGLVRLATMPRNNDPLPNDDYPDLSQMEIFL
jgi:dTDP-4-amino-4,6-dideoxygalactose transaminase